MTVKAKVREADTFIQWKGTDVCMDVYCECGTDGHIDNTFVYRLKCDSCGRGYIVGSAVALFPDDGSSDSRCHSFGSGLSEET